MWFECQHIPGHSYLTVSLFVNEARKMWKYSIHITILPRQCHMFLPEVRQFKSFHSKRAVGEFGKRRLYHFLES